MVSFGEKANIKKAGNLNYSRSYVITTVVLVNNVNNSGNESFLVSQESFRQISLQRNSS